MARWKLMLAILAVLGMVAIGFGVGLTVADKSKKDQSKEKDDADDIIKQKEELIKLKEDLIKQKEDLIKLKEDRLAKHGGESKDQIVELNADLLLGKAFKYKEMTFFPVYRKKAPEEIDYITLDEGIKTKVVIISERDKGGSVPELIIINHSDKPLYIMAGEVIYGGKQDRVINRDVIIPSKSGAMSLDVYCVEHGRWTDKSTHFGTTGKLAQKSVRIASNNAPDQGRVWKEVEKENTKNGAEGGSGSYLNSLSNKDLQKKVEDYFDEIEKLLEKDKRAVGVVIGIYGKFHSADIFLTNGLFKKFREKLIKSYIMDVLVADKPKDGEEIPELTPEIVKDLFSEAANAKVEREETCKQTEWFKREYKSSKRLYYNGNNDDKKKECLREELHSK